MREGRGGLPSEGLKEIIEAEIQVPELGHDSGVWRVLNRWDGWVVGGVMNYI